MILHQNITGLNDNKTDEFSVSLSTNPPHILCLTERRLRNTDPDSIALMNQNIGANFVEIPSQVEGYLFLFMSLFNLVMLG